MSGNPTRIEKVKAEARGDHPSLRSRIKTLGPVRGLLSEISDPILMELTGHAGLDFVCLDFEHGAISEAEAASAVRAADNVQLPVLARVRADELPRAARFLDAGGAGVIVAHVSTRRQADAAVRALFLPPTGQRGVGATRVARLGFTSTDSNWADFQNSNLVLGVQIEDQEGVRNAITIASHPHVSVVLIGTRDLSFDLGIPGQYDNPRLVAAIERVRTGCIGRAALGLMVRDLSGKHHMQAQVLLLGLGALLRYATDRFRDVG